MMSKSAIDSNVLVYLFDASDERKRLITETLLVQKPIISSQVISEYLNVSKRLLKLPKNEILAKANQVFERCEIMPVNQSTMNLALFLLKKYDFQLFDSVIVASAIESECPILYSEDLQHNQLIENRLRVINPFLQP